MQDVGWEHTCGGGASRGSAPPTNALSPWPYLPASHVVLLPLQDYSLSLFLSLPIGPEDPTHRGTPAHCREALWAPSPLQPLGSKL